MTTIEPAAKTEPKQPRKTSRRRRTKRSRRDETVEYALRPRTWDYYFSFRVSDPKSRWDPGPYSQLATLSLKGDLIRPTDTRFKHIEVTLSARQGMMNESRETSFRTIGSLSSSDDALYAYVFIPAEFVPELASVAQSGRICAVRLLGSRLRTVLHRSEVYC